MCTLRGLIFHGYPRTVIVVCSDCKTVKLLELVLFDINICGSADLHECFSNSIHF